jgi:hypothetical protein
MKKSKAKCSDARISEPNCPESGGVSEITGFLKVLQEMEEIGQSERDVSGQVEGPFFSRAIFGCKIRLGLGKRRRKR